MLNINIINQNLIMQSSSTQLTLLV